MSSDSSTPDQVWTTGRLLNWTRDYFRRQGIEEARLAAEILLAHAQGCKRIELYTRIDQIPDATQLAAFRETVKRAADHTPIAYLVGRKEFYSLDFEVSPAVLIPRPDTELLVERAIDHARSLGSPGVELLDVGTGSGCVAVAILRHLPGARAVATDVSAEALAVAQRNADRHGVLDRVRFVQAEGLQLPADCRAVGGFDLLVCNPPYIAAEEMAGLPQTIREHEPRLALTDGGDGLSLYRTLAAGQGIGLLKPGGAILVEIADGRGDVVRDIFTGSGAFEHVGSWRDAGGRHERVVQVRVRGSGTCAA